MNNIIGIFANILGQLMNIIYQVCNNYGITIFIFTVFTKIVLFPIGILIQKNSIKMVKMKPKIEELKLKYANDKEAFMEAQIDLFDKEKYHPSLGTIPLIIQIPIILALVRVIRNSNVYIENIQDMTFFNIDLSIIPTISKYVFVPIFAGLTTILLCFVQNRINVLQKEEPLISKLFTTIVTVGLTMYFVFLVPIGVGFYWILGDFWAILQLYLLNWIFPPENYIDYKEFNKIKERKKKEEILNKRIRKKAKEDYKKFFEEENIDNMKFVIYSEKNGFYKYYKTMIEYIIKNSDILIHYVTSDIDDNIFNLNEPQIKAYFVDDKHLIPLFMKIEADIVLMTTPDLQNYYLKKSIVRKDIEYIYVPHGLSSVNLVLNPGALDYYSTIFVKNEKEYDEIRALEKQRHTKEKRLIRIGYPLIDELIEKYISVENEKKVILIAPSWQEDNIMDSCIDELLESLFKLDMQIIVRPHPEYIKRYSKKIDEFIEKYKDIPQERLKIETDFFGNDSIYNSDILITDWSGIGYEFSFVTTRPCIYINTKMKVLNKNYRDINIVPIDIEIRDIIGKSIEKNDIKNISNIINEMISNFEYYKENNLKIRDKYIYNIGNSTKLESEYIIDRLERKK